MARPPQMHELPPAGWGTWSLRALLTLRIHDNGRRTHVRELVRLVEAEPGLELGGRPGKVVSDALRAEVNKGWVLRVDRGWYAPGRLPRSSKHRLRARVRRARMPVARD